MKGLLILLIIICVVFPPLASIIISRLMAFVPLLDALMPCLIVIAGIYLVITNAFR